MPSTRLSRSALTALPADVQRPAPAVLDARVGVVHLGIGAFHRAHQAVFTEDAMVAAGSAEWGILGVTQRSPAVRDDLAPQDGLYTVLERGAAARAPRVVGAVREVLFAGAAPEQVLARLADPAVRVVTLTVSEKGYRRRGDGSLDVDDPVVRADLTGTRPRSVVGQLGHGLLHRARADAGPVTVVCCDNIVANGEVLRGLVEDFAAALHPAASRQLGPWLAESVRFPSTMVDRIVPATTAADRDEVRRRLGVEDHAVVVAEPFAQWVLADDFAAARPPWELAGATVTHDVAGWERAKLRVLNASHSLVGYLGALRGHPTVAEALADHVVSTAVTRLVVQDVAPTLRPVEGLDLADYHDQVMSRFGDAAIRYPTTQIAMDGSQKLPQRVLGTVRDRLAAGALPEAATLVVGAWVAYVRAAATDGVLPLDDPLADQLRAAVVRSSSTTALVDELLSIEAVFGTDLPEHRAWRDLLVQQVDWAASAGRSA